MVMVTAAEIGSYKPSPYAVQEVGSTNPYRTPSPDRQEFREKPWMHDDSPKDKFPYVYRDENRNGYKVDYPDDHYRSTLGGSLKLVTRPDGTPLPGFFTKARDWEAAIDNDIHAKKVYEIDRIRKEKYGQQEATRTR
jgi:hypothetical protein